MAWGNESARGNFSAWWDCRAITQAGTDSRHTHPGLVIQDLDPIDRPRP